MGLMATTSSSKLNHNPTVVAVVVAQALSHVEPPPRRLRETANEATRGIGKKSVEFKSK